MTHKNQCVGTTHEGVDEMLAMQSKLGSMEKLVSDLRAEKFSFTRKDTERETQLLVLTGQLESRKKAVSYLQRTLFQDLLSLRRHTDGLEAVQSNGGERSPQFNMGRRRSSHALLSTATVAAMERRGSGGDGEAHATFVFGEASPPRVGSGVFGSEAKAAASSPLPRSTQQSMGGYRSGTGTTSDFTYLDAFRFLEELGIPMDRITEEGTTSKTPLHFRLLNASPTARSEHAFNKAPATSGSGGSAVSGLVEKQLATAIVQRNVLEVAYVEMKRAKERADGDFKDRLVVLEAEAERRSGSALLEVEEERRKERDTHRAELEAKDKRISEIRKELTDLSNEHSETVAKVTELEDVIAAAGNATTAAMAELKRDITIKATQIKTQTGTIEGLEEELDELKKLLEETTVALRYASKERDELKELCDSQEAELIPLRSTGAQVIDLKRTNAQLKDLISAGQKQITELKISIEELGEQLEMKNESLQVLNAFRTRQESTNAEAEVALGDAQNQIRQRDDRIVTLEAEITELRALLGQCGGDLPTVDKADPDGGPIGIIVDDPLREDGSVRRKRSARLASIAARSDPAGATRSLSGLCSSARESSRGDSSASATIAEGMRGSTTDAPQGGSKRRKSVKGRRKSTIRPISGEKGKNTSENGRPTSRPTSAIVPRSGATSARPPVASKSRRGSTVMSTVMSTVVPMNTFESIGEDLPSDLSHSDADDHPKELLVAQPSTSRHDHSLSGSVSINPTPATVGSTTTPHQGTTGILSGSSSIRLGESKEVAMEGTTTHTTTLPPSQPTHSDAASSPMTRIMSIPAHKRPSLVDSATMVQEDFLVFTSVPLPNTQRRRSSHGFLSGGEGRPTEEGSQTVQDQPTINSAPQPGPLMLEDGMTVTMANGAGTDEAKVDRSRKSSVADFSSASHNFNFSMSDDAPAPLTPPPPPPLEGPSPLFVDSRKIPVGGSTTSHRHVSVQTNLLTMGMLDEAVRVARQMGYNQATVQNRVSMPQTAANKLPPQEVEFVQPNTKPSLSVRRSVSPPHRHQVSPFRDQGSPNPHYHSNGEMVMTNPSVVGLSQAYAHDTSVTFSANTSVATSFPVQYPPAHHVPPRPHSAMATVNRALGTPTTCSLHYGDAIQGSPNVRTSEEDVSIRLATIQAPLHNARPQSALPMRMAKGGVREMSRKAKELVAAISANGWDGGVADGVLSPPPTGAYRPPPKAPIEVVYEGPGVNSGTTSYLRRLQSGGLGDPTQLRLSQPSTTTRSAMSRPLLTIRSDLSQQTRVPLWNSTATPDDRNVLGMTSKEAHAASNGSGSRPTRGKSAGRPTSGKWV